MTKRSNKRIITMQSKVIRFMRLSRRISQPAAAKAAGCSSQAIGHYENGRMEIPEARIHLLLELYGYDWNTFQEYLNGKQSPILNLKDECYGLLDRIHSEEKLKAVLTILQSFMTKE